MNTRTVIAKPATAVERLTISIASSIGLASSRLIRRCQHTGLLQPPSAASRISHVTATLILMMSGNDAKMTRFPPFYIISDEGFARQRDDLAQNDVEMTRFPLFYIISDEGFARQGDELARNDVKTDIYSAYGIKSSWATADFGSMRQKMM